MKRAFLLIVAALIVLLTCPSTDSFAGPDSPYITDPSVIAKPDADGPVGTGDNDDDDGDADGVAGFKTKWDIGGAERVSGTITHVVLLRFWWNLFTWYR